MTGSSTSVGREIVESLRPIRNNRDRSAPVSDRTPKGGGFSLDDIMANFPSSPTSAKLALLLWFGWVFREGRCAGLRGRAVISRHRFRWCGIRLGPYLSLTYGASRSLSQHANGRAICYGVRDTTTN